MSGSSKDVNHSRGWKLNNLTSVIHYSLGVSSNYSLFFLSSCWLFIIHNRFRVQRIALAKFRFNYNTFVNNITLDVIRYYWLLVAQVNFHFSTWSVPQATPLLDSAPTPGDFLSVQSVLKWSCLWRRLSSAYIHRYLP